jgi:hypothetical protein
VSPDKRAAGKREAARESFGPRAKPIRSFRKDVAVPADAPLWVMLQLKVGKIPALIDTGAQFSCMRSDVAEFLYLTGETCVFYLCSVFCILADGTRCEVTDAVKLHVRLLMGS